MTRGRETPHVADHRRERRGGDDVDAGNRHQPTHVLVAEDLLGDDPIDLREIGAEEVQLTQARIDGQALVDR